MMSSNFMVYFLSAILLLTSLFMILLVLIQRGRGGGLAGAFGGMGGQSAFGTRAGDVFTKITVVVAVTFILVAALLGQSMRASQRTADTGAASIFSGGSASEIEAEDGDCVGNARHCPREDRRPFQGSGGFSQGRRLSHGHFAGCHRDPLRPSRQTRSPPQEKHRPLKTPPTSRLRPNTETDSSPEPPTEPETPEETEPPAETDAPTESDSGNEPPAGRPSG